MHISEQTRIEAQIGFTIGILIGVFASWVSILFFVEWAWYFKLFTSIGEIGIVGSLLMALNEQFKVRRNHLEVLNEMKKMNKANPVTFGYKKEKEVKKNGRRRV